MIEVGAPTEITIGSGTGSQTYPLDRYYNYGAHEAIYLASEIGMGGTIKSLAFFKNSGSDLNAIENVSIYMKHTTATTLATGAYSTTGYTLVYSGNFSNSLESGWMEVNLDQMFSFSGSQNLSILTVKGYQQWISNYSQWAFTNTGTYRARQERSDTAAPTTLAPSSNLPNIRLKLFPLAAPVYPPQNVSATPGFRKVVLNWEVPISGDPITYKIYRNNSYLTSLHALAYTDQNLVNGQSYSYYLKAVYSGSESNPSTIVNATPHSFPARNLTAESSNSLVYLTWDVPADGTPTEYRVYRNDALLTTETALFYYDVDVVNGTTYSYYVVAVYDTEASAATPTVQASPVQYGSTDVIVGTGTSVTTAAQNNPINPNNRSVHGQSIYLASELQALRITGPVNILQLGLNIVTPPARLCLIS